MDAIIIIDVQNDFKKIMTSDFIHSIQKLIKYSSILKIPILWIKSHYNYENHDDYETKEAEKKKLEKLDQTERLKGTHTGGTPLCIKDTFGAEIIDEFLIPSTNNHNSIIIIKTYYSAFTNTELDAQLKRLGIDNLIFCGLTINTCIKATVMDALSLGYEVKIIPECVTAFNEKLLHKGLHELEMIPNVKIVPFEEYTNGFEMFCEDDTFILNHVFPLDLYNEDETFDQLIREGRWKSMKISGGTLSRSIDIQAIITNSHFIPIYRNPNDSYIEAETPTETLQKMFDYLNNKFYLDGFHLNHVFMKYYKSGVEGIGRHSDKTLDLLPNSYILNVSLGATRIMTFRSKLENGVKQTVRMRSNSCLIIGMETNRKWLHEVKPDKRSSSEKTFDELLHGEGRMSFTFRSVGTFHNKETNKLVGLGAPTNKFDESTDLEDTKKDDKRQMIFAFSEENRRADFDRNIFYKNGFWSLST